MFHSLLPLVGIIVVFVIIAAVFKVLLTKGKREPQDSQDYPYEKEPGLFSPAERSFLGVLEQAVNGQYRFMGKVRLADVVKVKTGMSRSARQNAFNRIQSKHLDFVACDPATLMVQFVVELDDETHRQSRRQPRDELLDKVLQAAGIPVFHFIAKRGYSVQDVRRVLSEAEASSKK
jgi:very-short-patch-repair endonuclease